jgi:hypothetical protein
LGGDFPQKIEAESIRQLLVQQDGVRGVFLQERPCLFQRPGNVRFVFPVFQVHRKKLAEDFVVFDDEDVCHFLKSPSG